MEQKTEASQTVGERAEFEKAYIAKYGDPSSVGLNSGVEFAWLSSAGEMWRVGRAALKAQPAPQPAPQPEYGPIEVVGDMVRNLLALDQSAPIYAAFHIDYQGKRACRTRPVWVSLERVVDGKWVDSARKDVPYNIIVWAKPQVDEKAQPAPADPLPVQAASKGNDDSLSLSGAPQSNTSNNSSRSKSPEIEGIAAQAYTCNGKGGDYEFIGTAHGAGTSRQAGCVLVYMDVADGAFYFRTPTDFADRMTAVPAKAGTKAQGANKQVLENIEQVQGEDSARLDWRRITAPGQVKVGDKLRFTIGDEKFSERVKQIINPGYPDEELIYNKRRNFYVITSSAIANFGSSKNVEFLARASAETGGVKP